MAGSTDILSLLGRSAGRSTGPYRTHGSLDDASINDGDFGFVGINQYHQPEQLTDGYLVESINGRIDGYWQPRKAMTLTSKPLTTTFSSLKVPFTLGSTSILRDDAIDEVLGSCIYSDPNSAVNHDSIVLATNSSLQVVSLADGTISRISFPTGTTVLTGEVNLIQAFEKVLVFRSGGGIALEWDGNIANPAKLMDSGPYTPVATIRSTNNLTVTSGLATLTTATDLRTRMPIGSEITVFGAEASGLTQGDRYLIVGSTATTLKFYVDLPDTTGTTVAMGKPPSSGLGYMRNPASPWATYFQRRLWCPYSYDWNPATGSYVDRGVADELVVSDILDSNTYDVIGNEFRVTAGISDRLVALHPFFDDAMIVLNRNSLHVIKAATGDLGGVSISELTREAGCIARRSVISHGNSVYFLSDNGVYGLEFLNDYNVRGTERPLSYSIRAIIERINPALAHKSCGIYFDNRYWLAVPLDGDGPATGNNAVLVYNFLNQAWESVDTFALPSFSILDFHIGKSGNSNDLYAVSSSGGVHKMNASDYSFDVLANNIGNPVASSSYPVGASLTTRAYTLDTRERKRFTSIMAQVRASSEASDGVFSFITEDPDSVSTDSLISGIFGDLLEAENTANLRLRLGGVRGYAGQIRFSQKAGRPKITTLTATATVTNRSLNSQK